MRFKCAHCGRTNRLVGVPLTFRQRRILKAISDLARDTGEAPSAPLIAKRIKVGLSTVKNELAHLEDTHEVHRPDGPKSGWAILDPGEEEELHAVPA